MPKSSHGFTRLVSIALIFGGLALGCGQTPAPKTDSKSVSDEAEKMKQIHEREMNNR